MTRLERRLFKLWLAVTVLTAVRWFLGWIAVLLIFTGIGIPLASLLEVMPTVWLYATAFLLVYVPLRRTVQRPAFTPPVLAGLAAAIVVVFAFAVPLLANRLIERRAVAIMAGDMGAPPLIEPMDSVAILVDAGLGPPDGKCWDECQRLLFSGLARHVLHGSLDALGNLERSPTPLVRHSIVPFERGCDNALLYPTYASRAEWRGRPPPPLLWEKLADFAARRLCFRSDRTRDARADLYLVSTYNFDPRRQRRDYPLFDLRLAPIEPFQRREVFRRQNERLVPLMRRTQLTFSRLAAPLRLTPPFTFDTHTPGHWTYRSTEQRGLPPSYDEMMGHWLRNDVRVTGLGGSEPVVTDGRTQPARPRNR